MGLNLSEGAVRPAFRLRPALLLRCHIAPAPQKPLSSACPKCSVPCSCYGTLPCSIPPRCDQIWTSLGYLAGAREVRYRQRNCHESVVLGSANGIPLNASTSCSAWPRTAPASICTTVGALDDCAYTIAAEVMMANAIARPWANLAPHFVAAAFMLFFAHECERRPRDNLASDARPRGMEGPRRKMIPAATQAGVRNRMAFPGGLHRRVAGKFLADSCCVSSIDEGHPSRPFCRQSAPAPLADRI